MPSKVEAEEKNGKNDKKEIQGTLEAKERLPVSLTVFFPYGNLGYNMYWYYKDWLLLLEAVAVSNVLD